MTALANATLIWGLTTVLWFCIWRGLCSVFVAEFRAELFESRRRLFLLVADGKIAPNHFAYARLRGLTNNLLAQAEFITLFNVVILMLKAAISSSEVVSRTEKAIKSVDDPELRHELTDIHLDVARSIHRHLRRLRWISPLYWVASPTLKAKGLMKYMSQVVEAPATPVANFDPLLQ